MATKPNATEPAVTADAVARADLLRELHNPGTPLLLPNVWDAASARTVASAGFGAVATASAAIAPSLGYEDQEGTPVDAMLEAVGRIAAAVDLPVTADLEHGYRLPPAELAARLVETGAVGCNLEDTDPATGQLADLDTQAEYLAAVRKQAPHLVLNARVDTFLLATDGGEAGLGEALTRARRYVEAGADCVYPIAVHGLSKDTIRALIEGVGAPINLVYVPGTGWSTDQLAAAGAARISFGPGLYHAVYEQLAAMVGRLAEGGDPYAGTSLEQGIPQEH